MADEQPMEISQQEQVFLDRIGIVLRGAKQIAAYMGVSPATIVRWRMRFRGRKEVRLCFPAFLVPTGRGYGLQLWSHTASIREWMDRWQQIDCAEAQEKAKSRRRPPKVKRVGETRKESAGQFEDKTEQTPYARHTHKCPTVREEPSKLGPTNLAQREELSVKVPKKCTCGTPEPCTAHD